MARGWTQARRERQAMLIHRWRPWEHSTGPRTPAGKARVGRNNDRGGIRRLLRQIARDLREQRQCLSEVGVRYPARLD